MPMSIWRDVIPWSEVCAPADIDSGWVGRLRHRMTTPSETQESGWRSGMSVWESEWEGEKLGIAWGWVVRGHRVVALEDPMQIATNARLVWSDGQPLTPAMSIVQINSIVHELPWQAWVGNESSTSQRRAARAGSGAAAERRAL